MGENLVDQRPVRVALVRRPAAKRDDGSAELAAARRREGFEQDGAEVADLRVPNGAPALTAQPRLQQSLGQRTVVRLELRQDRYQPCCGRRRQVSRVRAPRRERTSRCSTAGSARTKATTAPTALSLAGSASKHCEMYFSTGLCIFPAGPRAPDFRLNSCRTP
jgi:hypothetical protein